MKEKIIDDVFQEAFEDFFAKKKTTNEEGAPEGPTRDQDESSRRAEITGRLARGEA